MGGSGVVRRAHCGPLPATPTGTALWLVAQRSWRGWAPGVCRGWQEDRCLIVSSVLTVLRRGLVPPADETWLPSLAAEQTTRVQPMALMAEASAGRGPVATGPEAAWEQEQQ